MHPTRCSMLLSTSENKTFITCVISVSFVFSSDLFIFSIGTFTSSSFFVLLICFKVGFWQRPLEFRQWGHNSYYNSESERTEEKW